MSAEGTLRAAEVSIGGRLDDIAARGAEVVRRALAARTGGVLGLATGSSPEPLYRALQRGGPLAGATGFALDEYVGLAPAHPQSYSVIVRHGIAPLLGLGDVHAPDGTADDPDAAARAYERDLGAAGGVDVQILGIGSNGHIGFNEPGSPFDSRTRVVRLAERTRADNARFFDDLEHVPTHAITQGIGTILEARHLVLVAAGASKADAVAAALTGPVTPGVPGSALQLHPRVTVLLDAAAASLLPHGYPAHRA